MGIFFIFLAAAFFLAACWMLYRRAREAGRDGPLPAGVEYEAHAPEASGREERASAQAGEPGFPPVSLVLLQESCSPLDPGRIAECVERVTGLEIADDEEAEAFWAAPPTERACPVMVRGHLYAIVSMPAPYAVDRDWYVDDDTPEEMLAIWQRHRAWILIELVSPAPWRAGTAPLEFIGKLAAELADDATIAVVHPAERCAAAFDPETRTLLRRRPVKEAIRGPLRAIALLRSRPLGLSQAELTRKVHSAWNVTLSERPGGSSFGIVAENGFGFIEHAGIRAGIAFSPNRYVRNMEEAAAEIGDLRLRAAFEGHTCWMGVDFAGAAANVPKARVYQLLASLAAEFIDEDTRVLFLPEYRRAVTADKGLRRQLRQVDPLQAFFAARKPPLLQVKRDEPAMEKAVAEARRRWPEFVAAFVSRKTTHRFAIKRGFTTAADVHHEFMWIQVVDIHEDRITGILDNDPLYVQDLKAGDRVVSRLEDVVDWIYTAEENLIGNFTGPVILAAQKKAREE
jgi:uncharacterized protein YegJ (DUF2314 family)